MTAAAAWGVAPLAAATEAYIEPWVPVTKAAARSADSFPYAPQLTDAFPPPAAALLTPSPRPLEASVAWRPEAEAGASGFPAAEDADDPSKGMFAYHKALLPPNFSDVLAALCAALGLIVAAGGGIGGGGVMVPLCILVLGFRPKHAIALSNFTVLGGSVASAWLNAGKQCADGRPLVDWDIIVMMQPSTILGVLLGGFVAKSLPDFILTASLSMVLGLLSLRTLQKAIAMHRMENRGEARFEGLVGEEDLAIEAENALAEAEDQAAESEFEAVAENKFVAIGFEEAQDASEGENDHLVLPTPTPGSNSGMPGARSEAGEAQQHIRSLFVCFGGCVALTVLKGGGRGSIIGVACGSPLFWLLSFAAVPWVLFFGINFRRQLLLEKDAGARHKESEIEWDRRTTVTYPLLCSVAGVFAGLFGLGGGMIQGPLLLNMGVVPEVASATAAVMMLFTTVAACISFQVLGLLEDGYGFAGLLLGALCASLGHRFANARLKAARRPSRPVLFVGMSMVLGALLIGLEAQRLVLTAAPGKLLQPSALCSIND